ncbi:MAG: glycerophosphodiester phosphodiesterase family protein [Alphaproteobacteria bacterium]
MSLKLPVIIGHRGCAAYAPENTLEGLHTAADMGIEWVELDVKLTKDQVPVIFHDETLKRTTGVSGNVCDILYADIKELDAGSWFGDSFTGVKIPTLEEAVEVLLERDLGLNLEIKPCPGREKETAEVALDMLSQIWDDHDRLLLSSFQHVSLETCLELAEDWHRGFVLPKSEDWPENWRGLIEYLKVSAINFNGNNCTHDEIRMLLEFGKPLLAYTINDGERAAVLRDQDVYGFFSDAPDVLKDALILMH